MQNGKSRIKRVASAVIAGVMALQTVAPVMQNTMLYTHM